MVAFIALLSSGVWGTADFLGGLWAKRLHPLRVVTISQLGGMIAACAFFLSVSLTGNHGDNTGFCIAWGAGAGLSGVIGLLSLYAALAEGTMGVVSPITAMGALVPVLLGLARGDSWSAPIGIGLLIALAGAVLASGPELSGDVGRRPLLLAVVAALAFGCSLYCMDGGARHDLSTAMLAMRCASLTLLIPLYFVLHKRGDLGPTMTRKDTLILPLLGAGDLLANLLFATASSRGQVSVVAVLGSLYPVATLIWARIVLHERLRMIQLAGVACTILGVVLVTL